MREWARLYQTPLWLAAGFIALLALFAVTPDPARSAGENGPAATSEPTPGPGECVICGIDQECDPSSGRCRFVKTTPLPCVESAKFDEKAGFCLPAGAPTPIPTAEPLDEPDEELDEDGRIPRSRERDDFPFETQDPDERTPEPEDTDRPEPDRDPDEDP